VLRSAKFLGIAAGLAPQTLHRTVLMKRPFASLFAFAFFVLFLFSTAVVSQNQPAQSPTSKQRTATAPSLPRPCAACIRAHMEFLACDALRGRGSGTADELIAATYVAAQLRAYGVAPAEENGAYVQRVVLQQPKLTAPPQLSFTKPGAAREQVTWIHGKEFVALQLSQRRFSGPLRVVHIDDEDDSQVAGSIVLVLGSDRLRFRAKASLLAAAGAAAAMQAVSNEVATQFQAGTAPLPSLPAEVEGENPADLELNFNTLEVSPDAVKILETLPENTTLSFDSFSTSEKKYTWNAVGILQGSDPNLQHSAVVLSAHLDHLGIGQPVNGDDIYNGADDDASGTTAVLELARVLSTGRRPRRTVIFALFGSEEVGGLGAIHFSQHPPLPLRQIATQLEFEMIGRPDPAVADDDLWLTGWQRSNLGPVLAAHGAHLVADPHPEQNFFARSDNYVLAKKGVVAQTVASYGLHPDYHQPIDDLAHIKFKHLNAAIGSLIRPIEWLVNSAFAPKWNEGGRP
jgi:aminopeptidase YwaD